VKVPLVDVRLNVILDASVVPRSALSGIAAAAIDGGATLLQYRDKDATNDELRRTPKS
jgi:thiamine-phosphate pyrophosphorylase